MQSIWSPNFRVWALQFRSNALVLCCLEPNVIRVTNLGYLIHSGIQLFHWIEADGRPNGAEPEIAQLMPSFYAHYTSLLFCFALLCFLLCCLSDIILTFSRFYSQKCADFQCQIPANSEFAVGPTTLSNVYHCRHWRR